MPTPLSPETLAPAKGADSTKQPKTADDINDIFNELDKELEVKEPKVKEEKEVKEPEKEPDDDIDLIEPEEEIEKLDLKNEDNIDIEAPPRKKEILSKYPDLFKTFPFLEKMLYRDRQYTEMFGSFDDAREIAERAEIFDQFENQLLSGNTEQVLSEIKNTDENAFNKIVDDYLPTLAKVDREAYFHVVGNLNKRLIMEMVQEANNTGNDDLKQAALLVNQFVFGSAKFEAPKNRATQEQNPSKEAEEERLSFVRERFESSRDELQSQVDNTLRATISEYIDPRGTMSSYVKKNAVNDAMKILGEAIAADSSVVKNLDKLWRSAFENKFTRESLNKIKSYYLSKAKINLKDAILKSRAEALKDSRPANRDKETDDNEEQEENSPRRRIIPAGRPSQPKKNEIRKGESVTDFFMRD